MLENKDITKADTDRSVGNKDTKETSCILQFTNCSILRDQTIVVDDVWVRKGKILNPEQLFFVEQDYADIKIDCNRALLAPGFIDTQINGAVGVDFSLPHDGFDESIRKVSRGLIEHGVTSYCPTVVTSPPSVYKEVMNVFSAYRKHQREDEATILGLHLEGPFISKDKKGAHPLNCIREFPNGIHDVIDVYGNLDNVSIITLAPELPNATSVIKELSQRGIKVSLGHSMANLHQGELAVEAGATLITHLFNAMMPFHHRDPHLVGLLASDKIPEDTPIFYGMISDGVHTHPAALRMARRISPKGLVLVTDAIPAMGLPLGIHTLGQMSIEITEKGAYIANTNTLCGSTLNMNDGIKYFYKNTDCTRAEALEAATLHPAKMLGIDHKKGSLNYGCDADFVLLETDLSVRETFIGGQQVWTSPTIEPSSAKTIKNKNLKS